MRCKIILALLLALLLPCALAEEGPARVDCAPIELDGEWARYTLDCDAYAWCPLQLAQNGRLHLMVQNAFAPVQCPFYIALLDENLETVVRTSATSGGAADPQTLSAAYDLTAGAYWLRVESWNGVYGDFSVCADFAPSRGEENAGRGFDDAQRLESGAIRGFLSSRTDGAFYGNELPEASQNFRDYYLLESDGGECEITLSAVEADAAFCCTLYDADLRACESAYDNPRFRVGLEAGRYYLCVENPQRAGGDYLLRLEGEGAPVPSGAAEGYDATLAAGQSACLEHVSAAADACLWGSTDPGVVSVSQDGAILGVAAGEACVAAVPTDGSAAAVFSVAVR